MQNGLQMEKDVLSNRAAGMDEARLFAWMGRQVADGAPAHGGMVDVQRPTAAIPPILSNGRSAACASACGSYRPRLDA